jgi:RNA polymerase sigma-70 factor (ECF subfamily)
MLVAVLDPDVVVRSDGANLPPGAAVIIRGAAAVAVQVLTYARLARSSGPRSSTGPPACSSRPAEAVLRHLLQIRNGKIVAIESLT